MIYLDNAATTLIKPAAVTRAMQYALTSMSSPGRGGYDTSARAERTLFQCRELAAELFDMDSPERVVFTFNATHALNIAIKSMVRPGDSVLISGYEHNAVTRPLNSIENVDIRVFEADLFDWDALLDDFRRKIESKPSVVICTQVSNVFGYILPIDEIAELCHANEIPLIVDASQSAGCLPVRMKGWNAAFIAMPGHKGLYAPQGTGLLLCGRAVRPLMEGGTGSESKLQQMPEFLPDRLEAGTHNVPGIAGLLEGLRYVTRVGIDFIRMKEAFLLERLVYKLKRNDRVKLYAAMENNAVQSGVLSFTVKDRDCHWVAEQLAHRGIAVRAGLHCAPLAHRTADTIETGTVRASVSAMTLPNEIDRFVTELNKICLIK